MPDMVVPGSDKDPAMEAFDLLLKPKQVSLEQPVLPGVEEAATATAKDPALDTFDLLLQQRDQEKKRGLKEAAAVNPDDYAKTLRLSQTSSLPEDVVERNKDELTHQQKAAEAAALLSGSPITERWFDIPENRKIAHDSIDALTTAERALNLAGGAAQGLVDLTLGSPLRGVAELNDIAARGIAAPLEAALRAVGADTTIEALQTGLPDWLNPTKVFRGLGTDIGDAAKKLGPAPEDRDFFTEVAGGVGQMVGQITALALAGPVAAPALGALFLLTQGVDESAKDVEEAKMQGTVAGDAATVAGGAIVAATEKFGLDLILNKIPATYRSRIARILSGASVEAVQEISEGVLRNLTAVALYDPLRDPFKDVESDGSVAGVVGALVSAVLPGKQRMSWKETLDETHKALMSSPLTERDLGKATEHVTSLLDQTGVNFSIPAEALVDFAVESKVSVDEVFSRFNATGQMEETVSRGGNVKLTNEVFAREIMLSEDFARLSPFVRPGEAALTEEEAKSAGQDVLDAAFPKPVEAPVENPKIYDLTEDPADLRDIAFALHPDDAVVAREEYLKAVQNEGYDGFVEADKTTLFEKPSLAANPQEQVAAPKEVEGPVSLAEHEMGLKGLFETGRAAGQTQANTEQLLVATRRAAEANRRLYQERLARQEARKLTTEWRGERAKVEEETAASVHDRPVYAAMESIGVDRLDRSAVIEALGETADIDLLPKNQGRHLYGAAREQGIHPDIHAERYGFNSGKEMLLAMIDAKPVKEVIQAETDAEMARRHKDLSSRMEAKAAAIRDLHNDQTEAMLEQELHALRQAREQGRIKSSLLKKKAKERLRSYKISEIKPLDFLEEQKRKAALAGKLIRKGDWAGAAKAQYQRLLNFQYVREAYALEDKIQKRIKRLTKLANPATKSPTVDAAYMDQVRDLLGAYNFGPVASEATRERLNEQAVREWLEARKKDDGAVINVPQRLLREAETTHYGDMTLNDFYALDDTVKNLLSQGRRVKADQDLQNKNSYAAKKQQMLEAASKLDDKARSVRRQERANPGAMDAILSKLAGMQASVDKVELMLQDLDGAMIGPWHKAVFAPIVEAQTKELDAEIAIVRPLVEELEKASPEVARRLKTVYRIPSIDFEMRGSDILMMALNTGNSSNLRKMIEGMSKRPDAKPWTEATIEEALAIPGFQEEEAAWVQKVWDAFDQKLYPEVSRVFREEHSTDIEKIEPREVTIGGVKLKGGYIPMIYDPAYSEQGALTALEMMQDPLRQGSVNSGMTQARVEEYSAPPLLDIRKLYPAMKNSIHFITHYDAVRQVNRALRDPELAEAIKKKLGAEYHDEMKRWLKAIARGGSEPSNHPDWDAVFSVMRRNLTAATLGASGTTGVMQTLGLSSSVAVLGKKSDGSFSSGEGMKWLGIGLDRYASDPKGSLKMAGRLSGEIRHRLGNADREISQGLESIAGKNQWYHKQQRAGLLMISGIQFYSVDVPTWIGAYNQALSRNMSEADAVLHADAVLRSSQASGHTKDLSGLQRQPGIMRWATMFSTFFMLAYNQQIRAGADMKKLKNVPGAVARLGWWVAIPAVLEAYLRMEVPDDADDEELAAWWGVRILQYSLSSIPIAGRPTISAFNGFDYRLTSVEGLGAKWVRGLKALWTSFAEDKEITPKQWRNIFGAAGGLAGISGTSQLERIFSALEEGDDAEMYDYLIGYKDR